MVLFAQKWFDVIKYLYEVAYNNIYDGCVLINLYVDSINFLNESTVEK